MPIKRPIATPTSYVTTTAIGYADAAGDIAYVAADAPLPVTQARGTAPAPLQAQTSASTLAGPFTPLRDAPIHLQLTGTWTGTVTVQRSIDGGTTRTPLTVGGLPWARFSGNASEVIWEEGEVGATFYLDIVLTSGTLGYRVSQ